MTNLSNYSLSALVRLAESDSARVQEYLESNYGEGSFRIISTIRECHSQHPYRDEFDESAKHFAKVGDTTLLRIFLEHGKDEDSEGATIFAEEVRNPCIVLASERGFLETTRLLRSYRPKRFFAKTALQQAAKYGHLEVVRLLVNSSVVDPNAIWLAAQQGHLEIVKLLFEASQRSQASKALIAASRNGFENIVQYLHEQNIRGENFGTFSEEGANLLTNSA